MDAHVSYIRKAGYYHIRARRHIRPSLPDDVCSSLATGMVQSRLDYANWEPVTIPTVTTPTVTTPTTLLFVIFVLIYKTSNYQNIRLR